MQQNISRRGWRGWVVTLAVLVVLGVATPTWAQDGGATPAAAKARPAEISRNGVLILVKSAILALDEANKTGNYTVLRDLGSRGFQANTAAQLGEIFASQRAQGLDMAGIVVLDPQLTLPPRIEPNGMLHIAGFFPSVPMQVNFDMLWEPMDNQWRLFGLSVNVTSGSPRAPDSPPTPPPPTSDTPPPAPSGEVTVVPAPRLKR